MSSSASDNVSRLRTSISFWTSVSTSLSSVVLVVGVDGCVGTPFDEKAAVLSSERPTVVSTGHFSATGSVPVGTLH